ncbi:EamA family transporter [Cytophagales bacterium LB-30]|uniref:EamA family transporter n=1 Tax=Shiella aurantiaca TaxID=3058365 RepID=A0ABT8F286_9BACT|nr:EamA family transporter [Shiella aurantiaca]MDN4164464.1 EamA family transporter [Shiella aurantiaca]
MKKQLFWAYMAIGAICLIWGTTYLALRVAVETSPPFFFSAVRQSIAGVLLFSYLVFIKKVELPKGRYWGQQALAGFLMISLGNGLVAWGEMYVSSGLAALICSLMPVWVVVINVSISSSERLNWQILVGILIGMLGIFMVFSENLSEFAQPAYRWGILFTFLAAISWAGGSILSKKIAGGNGPFMNASVQMIFGSIGLYIMSPLSGEQASFAFTSEALYALVYLIVFGSIIAMSCYAYALSKLPVSLVSLYAYVNPLVAILLGAWVLNETLTGQTFAAIGVTLAGIYITNFGHRKNARNEEKVKLVTVLVGKHEESHK